MVLSLKNHHVLRFLKENNPKKIPLNFKFIFEELSRIALINRRETTVLNYQIKIEEGFKHVKSLTSFPPDLFTNINLFIAECIHQQRKDFEDIAFPPQPVLRFAAYRRSSPAKNVIALRTPAKKRRRIG
jgi:hypothetical protein